MVGSTTYRYLGPMVRDWEANRLPQAKWIRDHDDAQ